MMSEYEKKVYFESKRVAKEYLNSKDVFPTFNSLHEAYAVIKEELDEFWEVVKLNQQKNPNRTQEARKEAIQIAAMALGVLVEFGS